MKWYSYSYSIVLALEYEYEYCPSGGVRVRKTLENWTVMSKVMGNDKANAHRLMISEKHTKVLSNFSAVSQQQPRSLAFWNGP